MITWSATAIGPDKICLRHESSAGFAPSLITVPVTTARQFMFDLSAAQEKSTRPEAMVAITEERTFNFSDRREAAIEFIVAIGAAIKTAREWK